MLLRARAYESYYLISKRNKYYSSFPWTYDAIVGKNKTIVVNLFYGLDNRFEKFRYVNHYKPIILRLLSERDVNYQYSVKK